MSEGMKAALVGEFGGPEVLRVAEVARPEPGAIYGFQVTNLMQRLGYDPRDDLAELARLVAGGDLTVHVDRAFPLSGAADAHRRLEGCLNRGKVVLHPGEAG